LGNSHWALAISNQAAILIFTKMGIKSECWKRYDHYNENDGFHLKLCSGIIIFEHILKVEKAPSIYPFPDCRNIVIPVSIGTGSCENLRAKK
jgi:hypothetical protein